MKPVKLSPRAYLKKKYFSEKNKASKIVDF